MRIETAGYIDHKFAKYLIKDVDAFEKLKDNECGGNLHIILDDGTI